MTSDENAPISIFTRSDEANKFLVEHFSIRGHLHSQIVRAKHTVTRATHQTPCLMGRATFAPSQGRTQVAITFTYDLGLIRFLDHNRSFQRDKTICVD